MRFPLSRAAAIACAALIACAASAAWANGEADSNGVVNINTANADELTMLPGIGPSRAAAIIERRSTVGPFKRVEDLLEVSGIGEKALERLRPYCVVQGRTTLRP